MGIIKSIFISFYVTFLTVASTYTLFTFFANDDSVYWFSSALSTSIPLGYFIYLYLKKPADVQLLKMLILPMTGAALLISIGRLYLEGEEFALAAQLAFISFFGWLLYDMWYSKLPKTKNASNESTADWTFDTPDGEEINPAKTPSKLRMFVFIRGSWCPFCMAQLRDIGQEYDKLHDLDVQVNFVTHKADKFMVSAVSRMNPKINLLVDKNLRIATQLGLSHKNSTPLGLQLLGYKSSEVRPAVVIADDSGAILKVHTPKDYRNRPEPAWFLRLLDDYAIKQAQ
jgi:peroxiredoxin